MLERDDVGSQRLKRGLKLTGLGVATLFACGMILGILVRQFEDGGSFELRRALILGAVAVAAVTCGWLFQRTLRTAPTGEDPLTAKERLNRNILVLCGVLGAVIGLAMGVVEPRAVTGSASILSNGPLPPAFALTVVLLTGVLLPAVSIYWHRHATDEMETDAYKTGALYALNVYMIGAPVWWFLWRGGLAPAPDGIAIYMITVATVGIFWLWKKYR
jgi:hypothetical protein